MLLLELDYAKTTLDRTSGKVQTIEIIFRIFLDVFTIIGTIELRSFNYSYL